MPLLSSPFAAAIPSPPAGVWYIGSFPIRAYALLIVVGIVVAAVIGDRRYRARGGARGTLGDLALWAVPFGIVGGRIYHVLTDHQLYFGPGRDPWRALAIWEGGLGIWGAIALGGLGVWIGARRKGIPVAPVADALAPGLLVAQAIGRIGNYFNQELFGSPTNLPWGLRVFVRTPGGVPATMEYGVDACEFPTDYVKASPAVLCGAGTYHPTFLYELLWNLLIAVLIVRLDRRFSLGGGRVFALYVAGYCLGRGWIEMLRIDIARTYFLGLRINVWTSMVLFVLAVVYLVATRHRGRESRAYVRGNSTDRTDHRADAEEAGAAGPAAGDQPVTIDDDRPDSASSTQAPGV